MGYSTQEKVSFDFSLRTECSVAYCQNQGALIILVCNVVVTSSSAFVHCTEVSNALEIVQSVPSSCPLVDVSLCS